MHRSAEWLVCAAILFASGGIATLIGVLYGIGALGGVVFLGTGVWAVFVSRRFRKLERARSPEEFDRAYRRLW